MQYAMCAGIEHGKDIHMQYAIGAGIEYGIKIFTCNTQWVQGFLVFLLCSFFIYNCLNFKYEGGIALC